MRGHRLALLLAYLAALVGGANTAWAQQALDNSGVEQEHVVSRSEFYYYDNNKLRKPLQLSRSVALRLLDQKPVEERDRYLKQLGSVTVREIGQLYPRAHFALDYMPTQNQDARVATIKRLAADPSIEVAPIFTVDGMDAVVDGIYLQTVTPMSRETVVRALEKYFGNGIGIHEVTPAAGLWHISFRRLFFLNGEKLPLHVLSLANLLQSSDALPWVKRAYPKFAFLTTPVIASISVYPMSGTVGEERTVVLGFRVFGRTSNDVVIDDTDIPEFRQGKLVPLFVGKPPQESFIEVIKGPVKEKLRQVGPNEWYFEHRYTFFLGAPESEWVFPMFTIPYMYRGERKQMTIPSMTFFIRPHLDAGYALQDIPQALTLPVKEFPGFTQAEPTPIHAWFDPVADVIGGRKWFEVVAKVVFGSSTLIALVCFIVLAIHIASRQRAAGARRGVAGMRLAELLKQAELTQDNRESSQAYHGILSEVFHAWDPKFPKHTVTYQHVKDRLSGIHAGEFLKHLESTIGLEDMFEEIESRNDASFGARDENELKALGTSLRLKIEKLTRELAQQKT